ncbi:MAG: nitroreductase [Flavobacteriales bacterium]|nr:nitroreductase [Flavobacteriales bacterium]
MKYNLSEINEVIRNRRSVYPKQFSDRKVHREMIENMLENARWAPTHGLTQPWFFKVFMGDGLQKLAEFHSETYKKITPSESFLVKKYDKLQSNALQSSVVIAICMKRQEIEKIPEIEEIEAVACAVQNMHLTATAFGLGAYWGSGGLTYSEEMKTFLGLKKKDKCLGLFYIGYPDIEWPKGQRKPIEYFTEWVTE